MWVFVLVFDLESIFYDFIWCVVEYEIWEIKVSLRLQLVLIKIGDGVLEFWSKFIEEFKSCCVEIMYSVSELLGCVDYL